MISSNLAHKANAKMKSMLAKLSFKNSEDFPCCPPFLLYLDKNKKAHLLSTCVFLVNDGFFQFGFVSDVHATVSL